MILRRTSPARAPGQLLFYVLPQERSIAGNWEPPKGLSVNRWIPGLCQVRPWGADGRRWLVWWLFHHVHIFANRSYEVVTVVEHGVVIHRAGVFPRYFRFPFMARSDVQIGDVWTAPQWRGRGLATWSIAAIASSCQERGGQAWYVTESTNEASRRSVERAGLVLDGTGRRVTRLGCSLLGGFVMDPRPHQDS